MGSLSWAASRCVSDVAGQGAALGRAELSPVFARPGAVGAQQRQAARWLSRARLRPWAARVRQLKRMGRPAGHSAVRGLQGNTQSASGPPGWAGSPTWRGRAEQSRVRVSVALRSSMSSLEQTRLQTTASKIEPCGGYVTWPGRARRTTSHGQNPADGSGRDTHPKRLVGCRHGVTRFCAEIDRRRRRYSGRRRHQRRGPGGGGEMRIGCWRAATAARPRAGFWKTAAISRAERGWSVGRGRVGRCGCLSLRVRVWYRYTDGPMAPMARWPDAPMSRCTGRSSRRRERVGSSVAALDLSARRRAPAASPAAWPW